jgi:aryl sulfotransferase
VTPVVYRTGLTDSRRWRGFELRADDIVVSVPSKCGTTWAQMICALLVFRTADLPGPLTTLSPWLDMRLRPLDDVARVLAGQQHRRFIKTHTPLDGLPQRKGVSYLVVGRDPLDVAVSMDHHRANLDTETVERLLGEPPARRERPDDQRERVLQWIHDERPLDSLRGVVHHLRQAWERRDEESVILVHHADLSRDLEGQMRLIAARLGVEVPSDRWPALVEAAGFDAMRDRADELAPDERLGLFASRSAFFRSGRAGQGHAILGPRDLAGYDALLRSLAGQDFVEWVTRGHPAA